MERSIERFYSKAKGKLKARSHEIIHLQVEDEGIARAQTLTKTTACKQSHKYFYNHIVLSV